MRSCLITCKNSYPFLKRYFIIWRGECYLSPCSWPPAANKLATGSEQVGLFQYIPWRLRTPLPPPVFEKKGGLFFFLFLAARGPYPKHFSKVGDCIRNKKNLPLFSIQNKGVYGILPSYFCLPKINNEIML